MATRLSEYSAVTYPECQRVFVCFFSFGGGAAISEWLHDETKKKTSATPGSAHPSKSSQALKAIYLPLV